MKNFAQAWPFFLAAAIAGSIPWLLRYPIPAQQDWLALVELAAILVSAPAVMICGPLALGAMRGWDWPAAIGFYVAFHVTYYLAYLLAPSTDQLIGPAQLGSGVAIAGLSLGVGASARELSQGRRLDSRGPLLDAWPYLAGIGALAGVNWVWAMARQACDVTAPGLFCGALEHPPNSLWLDGLFLFATPPLLAFLAMMLLGLRRGGDLLTVALCLIVAAAMPTAVYCSPAICWTFLMGLGYAIPGAGGFAIGALLRRSLHTRYTTRASR